MATEFGSESAQISFLVTANLVFTVIAAFCSSPQTAEINANKRAKTLMKWVNIGMINSVIFVAVAISLDKEKWPSIMGGTMAGTSLYLAYEYAKRSGLNSAEAGTES